MIATGTFTDPGKLAPLLADEVKRVHELRDEGIIAAPYLRAGKTGVVLILDVPGIDDGRERLAHLPFAKAGLLRFEFAEVTPF